MGDEVVAALTLQVAQLKADNERLKQENARLTDQLAHSRRLLTSPLNADVRLPADSCVCV